MNARGRGTARTALLAATSLGGAVVGAVLLIGPRGAVRQPTPREPMPQGKPRQLTREVPPPAFQVRGSSHRHSPPARQLAAPLSAKHSGLALADARHIPTSASLIEKAPEFAPPVQASAEPRTAPALLTEVTEAPPLLPVGGPKPSPGPQDGANVPEAKVPLRAAPNLPEPAFLAAGPVAPLVGIAPALAPREEIAIIAPPSPPSTPAKALAQARPTAPAAPAKATKAPKPRPAGPHVARRVIPQSHPSLAPVPEKGEGAQDAGRALTQPVLPTPAFGQGRIALPPADTPSAVPASARVSAPVPATTPTPGAAALALPRPAFGTASANPRPAASTVDAGAALAERASGIGTPGTGQLAPFTEDDELILELQTPDGGLSDTISAYGTRSGVYLPLGELARLLDLAIVVSDDGRYAAGWVLDDKNTIALNLRAGTLKVGARDVPLGPGDAQAMDGELYLRAEMFQSLMPLTLKVDLRRQLVTLTTLRPFPFEQRAAREAARERLAGRNARGSGPAYPRESTPWQALSVPVSDVELRAVSDAVRGTRGETDLRVAGDIAFLTGQAFLSTSSRDGLVAARIELGRRDPDANLLGPFRATQFEMGDIATDSLPLGLRGVGGRGFTIANTPLERASVFDKIDLRGALPAGYEAELYRNNTLIGSTSTPVNGQYEFLQVPVEFGLNVFRVVLYGPQGQRLEDVRQVSVGDGRLARGQLVYSFGIAQKDVNLLDVRPPGFVPGLDFGAWRATGLVQYGLSAGLTATLGGAWYESGGARHWLATSGLRTGIGRVAAQLDLGINELGGKAIEASLGGSLGGVSWTASHAEYLGTFSDEVRSFVSDPLRRASEVDLTATLRLGSAEHPLAIPMAARMQRIAFADGRVQTDASLRASMMVGHLLFSNGFTYYDATQPGSPSSRQLTGTFDLASLSGSKTQYRASLGYTLLPGVSLTTAGVEVDHAFGPDTRAKVSLAQMLDSHQTLFGLSAVKRLGPVALAFDGTVSVPGRAYSAVLRLGFSFGRNPISHAMFLAPPGMALGGAVAARAFEDDNGNHRYDPGEPVLPDVTFDTGTLTGRTGKDGVALIGGLGDATRTYLRLNAETLPDVAMAPARAGVEIIPRPGRIHASDFAVDKLGDIEGTAYFGADRQGVSGLALRLVDAAGKPVARDRTSSGGAFYFEQLHPGTYRVEIDPAQAKRLGLRLDGGVGAVTIDAKGRTARLTIMVSRAD